MTLLTRKKENNVKLVTTLLNGQFFVWKLFPQLRQRIVKFITLLQRLVLGVLSNIHYIISPCKILV